MVEEHEDRGQWMWGFVTGFIIGALVMVGIGGALWFTQARRAAEMEERVRAAEMIAREEAERARYEAEAARAATEARLKEADAKRKTAGEKGK